MERSAAPADDWRATLRLTRDDGPAAFDAVLVLGGARGGEVRSVAGETPYELAIPPGEVTVVVRPRDAGQPVVAEFTCEADGEPVARGRGFAPIPVLHFRPGSVVCTGLPAADGADGPAGCLTNR